MSGALSIDWALMPTSRPSAEVRLDPAVALGRESLASDFFPPPAGDASPVAPVSGPAGHRGTPRSRDACGAGGGSSRDDGACSAPWSPCCDTSDRHSDGRGGGAAAGVVGEGGDGDVDETGRSGGGRDRSVCRGAAGDYRASPEDGVPRGLLTATALMFDAVELGVRVLAAAGKRGGRVGDGGWAGLAAGFVFEGLSGKVRVFCVRGVHLSCDSDVAPRSCG